MHQISIDPQNVTEKLLKSAKFKKKNQFQRRGLLPILCLFFLKSFLIPYPESKGIPLEMLILFKLCLPILVQ